MWQRSRRGEGREGGAGAERRIPSLRPAPLAAHNAHFAVLIGFVGVVQDGACNCSALRAGWANVLAASISEADYTLHEILRALNLLRHSSSCRRTDDFMWEPHAALLYMASLTGEEGVLRHINAGTKLQYAVTGV